MRIYPLYLIVVLGLVGCASTSARQSAPNQVAGIHEVEVVVFVGPEVLRPEIPEPDYKGAHDLVAAFGIRHAYDAQLKAADQAIQPLVSQLDRGEKQGIAEGIRKALEAAGIKVVTMSIQVYDGSQHSEESLEQRIAEGQRGTALLVVTPRLGISPDYRVASAGAAVSIYRRESSALAAARDLQVRSEPVGGDDPVVTWSASGASAFSSWLGSAYAQLGQQVAQMFAD